MDNPKPQADTRTQWISLNEIVAHCGINATRRHHVEQVRPLALFRSGDYRIVRNPIADGVENIIHKMLADTDERRTFSKEVQSMLHYTEVVFECTALVEWMQTNDLPIPDEWKQYSTGTKNKALGDDAANDNHIEGRPTITLSNRELVELTGKHRGSVQHRVLNELGIPSKVRNDGAVVVLRCDLQAANSAKTKAKPQPNFDALVK